MVAIPGLPLELATIPPAPLSFDDPEADHKRTEWRRWRYAVMVERTKRHLELKANPDLIPFEAAKCAQHPAYWAAMWLRVFEPRWRVDPTMDIPDDPEEDDPDAEKMTGTRKIVLPDVPAIVTRNLRAVPEREGGYDPALDPIFGYVPFICFADQVRVINELLWTLTQTDENADAIWSKSRGWGASWILCLIGLWGWTFSHQWPGAPPWNILYLSRKEEYVDSNKQRSLFWKIRRLMRDMPDWQMPAGWNPDKHDQKGNIINPFNGNELGGESTNANAGRGDRVTAAIPDELAAIAGAEGTWSTLNETTDHRWGSSTENNEEGPFFYEIGIGRSPGEERPHLIETDAWQNPLNDDAWLARQKKRYANDPDAFDREILRNPFSGHSTFVYPWARTKEADGDITPVSGWPSYVSIDPGFRDPTALVAIQETPNGEVNVVDAYAIEGKEADYFVPLLKPEFFADIDTNWSEKSYLTWSPPSKHGSTQEDGKITWNPSPDAPLFEYQEREISFARTVAILGKPTYIGDTYGESLTGATNDSVYSRWRKYGIFVNRDRSPAGDTSSDKKRTRTFAGRREALNDRANRFRFGATDGARVCLKALKDNKYKPRSDRPQQSEPKVPLHDWTSHYVSALEFFAVHIRHRHAVLGRELSKPLKASLGGQIGNMGAKRNSLRPLTPLRGAAD
jgi:hypothetical protein